MDNNEIIKRVNGLMARYAEVARDLGTAFRTVGRAEAAIANQNKVIAQLEAKLTERNQIIAALKTDNRSFAEQLRSLSLKVDELARLVGKLEDRLSPPELKGGHPGLPYTNHKGEVA